MPAYVFDRFVFAPDARRLDGPRGAQALRPKTASLLRAFLERPREVVTKAQLFEWVWPGICVVDNVLAQGIRELRAALGDDARAPRFLRTLPAAGYVWLTAVHAAPPDGARARAPSVGMDVDA